MACNMKTIATTISLLWCLLFTVQGTINGVIPFGYDDTGDTLENFSAVKETYGCSAGPPYGPCVYTTQTVYKTGSAESDIKGAVMNLPSTDAVGKYFSLSYLYYTQERRGDSYCEGNYIYEKTYTPSAIGEEFNIEVKLEPLRSTGRVVGLRTVYPIRLLVEIQSYLGNHEFNYFGQDWSVTRTSGFTIEASAKKTMKIDRSRQLSFVDRRLAPPPVGPENITYVINWNTFMTLSGNRAYFDTSVTFRWSTTGEQGGGIDQIIRTDLPL